MDADLIFTDSDGVLKYSKQPIAQDLIDTITQARGRKLRTIVVRITGAPASHLLDGLIVDRAFAEAGGVELLHDGTILVSPHAHHAAAALRTLKQALGITEDDGHITTQYGTFGLEGIRHTTFTPFFGTHPFYPGDPHSADHEQVADWIESAIQELGLPLYMMSGKTDTYHFLDIGHPDIMKKETIVDMILKEIPHARAYYLGDSGNDAGAMRKCDLTPVTFSNGTPEIRQIVEDRDGIMMRLPGPEGGSKEFFQRLIDETL